MACTCPLESAEKVKQVMILGAAGTPITVPDTWVLTLSPHLPPSELFSENNIVKTLFEILTKSCSSFSNLGCLGCVYEFGVESRDGKSNKITAEHIQKQDQQGWQRQLQAGW